MTDTMPERRFHPGTADTAGVLTWVHIGDLHLTEASEQNDLDLQAIVDEINQVFVGTIAFVYLPGDIAEHGRASEYQLARRAVDRLRAPWCSIVGDHDVHERAFTNYREFAQQPEHYSFEVGKARFLALNAFDVPDPGSFGLLPEQLEWVQREVDEAAGAGQSVVVLLHCYPSDLKQGARELARIAASPSVRLIDMGHTHYNEAANDGSTLYTATRSTGQIEEGPVGFSVTNIDGGVISWRFVELNQLPVVMITAPADERFLAESAAASQTGSEHLLIRAKVWSRTPIQVVEARLLEQTIPLSRVQDSQVWEGRISRAGLPDGVASLGVTAKDQDGAMAEDRIRIVIGPYTARQRAERDQDNAIEAWPERGLLGTQLGPNKNGRKW